MRSMTTGWWSVKQGVLSPNLVGLLEGWRALTRWPLIYWWPLFSLTQCADIIKHHFVLQNPHFHTFSPAIRLGCVRTPHNRQSRLISELLGLVPISLKSLEISPLWCHTGCGSTLTCLREIMLRDKLYQSANFSYLIFNMDDCFLSKQTANVIV